MRSLSLQQLQRCGRQVFNVDTRYSSSCHRWLTASTAAAAVSVTVRQSIRCSPYHRYTTVSKPIKPASQSSCRCIHSSHAVSSLTAQHSAGKGNVPQSAATTTAVSSAASTSTHTQSSTYTIAELIAAIQHGKLNVPLPSTSSSAFSSNSASSSPTSASSSPSITIRGWVRSIRSSKSTSFVQLNDGTSLFSMQCVVDSPVVERAIQQYEKSRVNDSEGATTIPAAKSTVASASTTTTSSPSATASPSSPAMITNGASLSITGRLVYTQRTLQSLSKQQSSSSSSSSSSASTSSLLTTDLLCSTATAHPSPQLPLIEIVADSVHIVGLCDGDYPISKQSLPLDYLRSDAVLHLRYRTALMSSLMRIRSAAQLAIHHFFDEQGFVHTQTPVLTPLDAEGAGEVFQVTSSFDKPNQQFFNRAMYLSVSGQLYGELACSSLSRVYTFGPTFRAEHSNTTRHLSEFWMIEPEMAHATLQQTMEVAEQMVKDVTRRLIQLHRTELTFIACNNNSIASVYVIRAKGAAIIRSRLAKYEVEDDVDEDADDDDSDDAVTVNDAALF